MLVGCLQRRNESEWAGKSSFIYRRGSLHENWVVIEMKVFLFWSCLVSDASRHPSIWVWIKCQEGTCIQKDGKEDSARDKIWKEIKEDAQVNGMDLKGMV